MMLSTRSPTDPRSLFSVVTAPHAVTSVHWQIGQLLACLKEHPLLRPIFQAFLSVVCLLLKHPVSSHCPRTARCGVHALQTLRKCSWAATEAEAMMAMVAGSCVAEACSAAAVLPVRARLD